MKRKLLAIVALVVAAGLWIWRSQTAHKTTSDVALEVADGRSKPDQKLNSPARLTPPNPARRFMQFTPEQRVEFARKGHGPGG